MFAASTARAGGKPSGNGTTALAGQDIRALMRMECKNDAVTQFGGAALDAADS
jgi:hypothetical protein